MMNAKGISVIGAAASTMLLLSVATGNAGHLRTSGGDNDYHRDTNTTYPQVTHSQAPAKRAGTRRAITRSKPPRKSPRTSSLPKRSRMVNADRQRSRASRRQRGYDRGPILAGGRHSAHRRYQRRHYRARRNWYFSSRWLFHGGPYRRYNSYGPEISVQLSGRHALAWLGIAAVSLIMFDRLTSRQRQTHATVYQRASTARIGETVRWQDGNSSGAVTATRDGTSMSGRYCREYQQSVTVNGKRESAYGVACRRPDGNWELISPAN